MILNEDLSFEKLPEDWQRTFRGRRAEKRLLGANHLLFKFTEHGLFKTDGTVTPFWSSIVPITPADPGLAGMQARAAALNCGPAVAARARSAVSRQWNGMTNLLEARLLVEAYAFVGQCSGQRINDDDQSANVVFIGGAWQLLVPNLGRSSIIKITR